MPVAEIKRYQLGDSSFVEGLGVHRSANANGQIDVRVRKSTRRLILLLSAHEPVLWKLSLEAGADIAAILLSGSMGQSTSGGGAIEVIDLGRLNVFDTASLAPLQTQVAQRIGRPLDKFQGQYEARAFTVGGLPDASLAKEDKYGIGDSLVNALGAYGGGAPIPGQVNLVDVRVQKSSRPLVLVLDSNEVVRWNLSIAAGAEVKAVFLTGASGQSVIGAGGAQVIHLSITRPFNAYPNRRQEEIEQTIGHRIGSFGQKILGERPLEFVAGASQ